MQDQRSEPIERFLCRLLKRSALNSEEQQGIRALSGSRHDYRAHNDIVSPGQDVDHACLIASGLVGRFDQMRDGERQITAFYIAGDMCDLHSVVAPKASWSITAVSSATAVHVPHCQLRSLALRYPAIALALWRDATVDASILAKWVGNLGRKGSASRIAHIICEMALRNEYAGLSEKTSFNLPATQEQLADATGMTSVHLNRMLKELRGLHLLNLERSKIEILDWEGLASLAEFDPAYLMLDEPFERASLVRPEAMRQTAPAN